MISIDANKRPSITDCIEKLFKCNFFPQSFKDLFNLGSAFGSPKHIYSDYKIAIIRLSVPKVAILNIQALK